MIRLQLILILLYLFFGRADGQNRGDIRVMSYNTENLFDTIDNPLTEDNEFTPAGRMHWTAGRYHHKLLNIYKVIAGVGGWQPPEIIGLVEIENRQVIMDLLSLTPLSKFRYNIIHYESPDPRGIDVALLVRSEQFKILEQEPIDIHFINQPTRHTRNILYVKLLYKNRDTLYVFVNHWPSRRGGEIESEDSRMEVASILRTKAEQIFKINRDAKMIIMGDFNDEPSNMSITGYLKARPVTDPLLPSQLYNLSYHMLTAFKIGTHYFRGHWSVLDQVIVSGSLLASKHGLHTNIQDNHIYSADFIIQPDKKNLGIKPLPTYSGPKYIGGYSDHLPVYLDLYDIK